MTVEKKRMKKSRSGWVVASLSIICLSTIVQPVSIVMAAETIGTEAQTTEIPATEVAESISEPEEVVNQENRTEEVTTVEEAPLEILEKNNEVEEVK